MFLTFRRVIIGKMCFFRLLVFNAVQDNSKSNNLSYLFSEVCVVILFVLCFGYFVSSLKSGKNRHFFMFTNSQFHYSLEGCWFTLSQVEI